MPRLAANVSLMFAHLPLLDRLDAAAAAGFEAVEFSLPYDVPAHLLSRRARDAGLAVVLFNIPVGDWARGDRGIAANPGRVAEFRHGVGQALDYAAALDCFQLHIMPGIVPPDADRTRYVDTFVDNVRYAADQAGAGTSILLEAVNTRIDIPDYLYDSTAAVCWFMDAAARSNVRMQYDIYHMQVMEGDLARTIERMLPRIAHIQLADHPGRGEPGTGEIGYPWLLLHIDALGYTGWIGCEYRPTGDTAAGLHWASPYLQHRKDIFS